MMTEQRTTTSIRKPVFGVLLLLVLPLSTVGQQISEYVDNDTLQVGDLFSFSLVLNKSQVYDTILFPDSSHFESDMEMRSRQHYRINEFKDSLSYQLQFFGIENSRIDSLPVLLVSGRDTAIVYSTPLPLYFQSTLQPDDQEFRPLKPIFDFARLWWPYLIGLLLAGLLAWYLYRYYQTRETSGDKPQPVFQSRPFNNPLQQLENSLRQLKNYSFESDEDFKQFYVNLGDAIRTYFEHLYRIPALESTSREIIYLLEQRMVDDRLVEQTRNVLREADMVKFAKFRPTVEQAEHSLSVAHDFLEVAQKNDQPKIERLRRQHLADVEREKKYFEQTTETLKMESE